ncbi:EpsG family protein [Aquimarina sp. U1-2]|uniref:EpsG family protein n=1 Tax=Aquimarina sp. U1-2 TaxID=2823141 RepID=UPI001AECA333|nr:EpsG family protein [Aquimarina sp. U1-2]MBP2832016.1 EpsG family protein [Aquimarina sp. U1-2]
MFDFVPIDRYSDFFFHAMFLLCLFTFLHTMVLEGYETKVYSFNHVAAFVLLVVSLCYIGFRPISGVFIDMTTYLRIFERVKSIGLSSIDEDIGFYTYVFLCSKIMNAKGFFFVSACIYIIPLFIACRKWFPQYYYFAFLLLVGSFSFWAYGTNGIRNGMAGSLFILALSFNRNNNVLMLVFFGLAYLFHTSLLLPIVAFFLSYLVTDTKKYIGFWILAIFLSISMGKVWENLFASIGFGDDRLSSYLTAKSADGKFKSTGFRFDFLLYSAAPIILACYYKFKLGYKDIIYDRILHTYITVNAFWIMIIRANFSNRFAYLSWFFMALVVVYPLLKKTIWDRQFYKLGIVILCYYGFTYLMFFYYELAR